MFWCRFSLMISACLFVCSACSAQPLASRGAENCNNRVDDNGDGEVDCDDPKCADAEACQRLIELCDNKVDDNDDGHVDCDDSQCNLQSCGLRCTCRDGKAVLGGQGGGGQPTGGGEGGGSEPVDDEPEAFVFEDVSSVSPSLEITSNEVTPTDFTGPLTLTCSSCSALGRNGTFGGTTVHGVMLGDTIAVRVTSAGYGGMVTTRVTLGKTTSPDWTVATRTAAIAWSAGPWSDCSNTCGSGTQTRTVNCTSEAGTSVDESQCTDSKPSLVGACTGTSGCTDCTFPWGGTLKSGRSVVSYSEKLPKGPCVKETRICTDGALSGSFQNKTCTVGCALPWGGGLASGESVKAYDAQFGRTGKTCDMPSVSQTRKCTNGVLSGTFTHGMCLNYPCLHDGARFVHYQVNYPVSSLTVAAAAQSCYGPNGVFTPAVYTGPSSVGPCPWGNPTRWYESTVCANYDGKSFRCFGGAWSEVSSGLNGCPPGP